MQSSKEPPDKNTSDSGYTRVPLDDSLANRSPSDGLDETVKSPAQFGGTNGTGKTFDSEKYRRELIRSLKVSSKGGNRPRHNPRKGSHRLGGRSLGVASIIICTLLVTSAYASAGPLVWANELTTVMKDAFSLSNNKGSQSSPVVKDRTNPATNDATGVVTEDAVDDEPASHGVSRNDKENSPNGNANQRSSKDSADSASDTEDTNSDTSSDAVVSTSDDSGIDNTSPTTADSTSAGTTYDSGFAGGAGGGGGGGSSPPVDNSGAPSSGLVPASAEPIPQSNPEPDTTPPTVIPPPDVTVEATGNLTMVELGTPTVSDLEDPSPTVSNDAPAEGFPVGNTTVTWMAMDASGNNATAIQNVTVTDTGAPTLTVPSIIIEEASGSSGAVIDYSSEVSAYDLRDGPLVPVCDPSSGSMFALGTTTVTCSATNSNGNTTSSTFDIVVQDTTAPAIVAPADITMEAEGALTLVSIGSPSVDDEVDDAPAITNNAPAEGFPVGTTAVVWTAVDASGNTAMATQTVAISDTTPPTIIVPSDITIEANGTSGTVVQYSGESATDLVDGSLSPVCTPTSGSMFALGVTIVNCEVWDMHDNMNSSSFSITVYDTTPPTITPPADIVAEANGTYTAVQLGSPTVSDLADASPVVTNNAPAEGFPVGNTTVTWIAMDASGNYATASQLIIVKDTTPPTIIPPPDVTVEATGALTLVELGTPTVSDMVDDSPTVTNNAPLSGFLVGTTPVTWIAVDNYGNTATATQMVTVVETSSTDTTEPTNSTDTTEQDPVLDTTPPTIIPPPDVTVEATGALTLVELGMPTVSDMEDPSPTVTNDAPADGFPVGTTTVTWTATDASGNTATATQMVTVEDTTPPTITPPADIVAEANGTYTAVQLGSPTVSDLADASPVVTNNAPAEGFPVGNTTVTWMVMDASGNYATASQLVTIVDSSTEDIVSYYDYAPSFAADGSNYYDIPHRLSLSLEKFSLAAWFKTSKDYTGDGMIASKNGVGLETAGNNLNYGMWLDKNEVLKAGFEDSSGVNYFVISSSKYNDGNWHYAVVTYDGSAVALFVDNNLVGTLSTTAKPDTGGMNSYPLRIGANSQANDRYFEGEIDEIRLWNRALTATDIDEQYSSGIFSTDGLLLHMNGTGHDVMSSTSSTVTPTLNTYYTIPTIGGVKPTTVAYGSTVYTVCDTTCSHTTIQSAIDALPLAGGKVLLKGPKIHDLTSTVALRSNLVIEFEPGAAVTHSVSGKIFAGENINNVMFINPVITKKIGPHDAIYITNGDTIIIKGGTIKGVKGGPQDDKSNGFECRSCKNVLVEGGTYSSWSRPIATTTMTAVRDGTSENIWVEGNTVSDGSIECMRVAHSVDVHVIDNDVRDCGNNGVDVGYNLRTEIKYNNIVNAGFGTVDNAVGIHTDRADIVVIVGNTIDLSGTNGISLCSSDNNYVVANTIRDSGQVVSPEFYPGGGTGVEIIRCSSIDPPENTIVDQNTITGSNDGYGVYIGMQATNTSLTNNILLNNMKGPYLDNGSGSTISGNSIN